VRTVASRNAIAVFAAAIAIALTALLPELLAPMRFFFLWCAVLIAALIGGTAPALLCALICIGAATLFLFATHDVTMIDVFRLTLFSAFATAIGFAVGLRRSAEERAAALNAELTAEAFERRRQEENTAFINRASEMLAASLVPNETMRSLTKLAVPALGDWCAVHLGTDANYERVAIEHADREKVRWLEELGRAVRPAPEQDGIVHVLTTRRTVLVEEFPEETLVSLATASGHYELLRKLGFRSWIVAPMIARGRVLGALTVVYGESGRHYTQHDVPVVEDLARRAAVAIDNARLYEAAEAANRAKDEFLATLSHELRTPLTAISGWAHMLELGLTDEATSKLAVATIVRSAKQQAELIDDLLDLSRVVAGTLRLTIADVDVAQLAADVALAAKPAADAKSIELALSVPSQPVIVRGDDRRLRQIIWNLVTNAVKFTDAGGRVEVTLAAASASTARLEVVDTGRGIDAAFLPMVWDRFRQADSSTSREHGGLGLGLAVVRHLVEMHGGTVAAESAGLGRGATFRVELPLARATQQVASDAPGPRLRRLEGKRVLVVDDDEDARMVLAAMLRQGGANVVAACDVTEAVNVLTSETFDAVLSDLAMPGEDGFALVRRVHALRRIPVVAVSAMSSGADDRRRALDAGFAEFVRKPVDPDELVETVARLS